MAEITSINPTQEFLRNPYRPRVPRTPGEQVPVYNDPYFEQSQEDAAATLVRKIMGNEQRELWLMELSTGTKVRRWIKIETAV